MHSVAFLSITTFAAFSLLATSGITSLSAKKLSLSSFPPLPLEHVMSLAFVVILRVRRGTRAFTVVVNFFKHPDVTLEFNPLDCRLLAPRGWLRGVIVLVNINVTTAWGRRGFDALRQAFSRTFSFPPWQRRFPPPPPPLRHLFGLKRKQMSICCFAYSY